MTYKSIITNIILILLLSSNYAYSISYKDYFGNPNFRLQFMSVNDGLPQQAITSIVQDKFGFMWLGTYDGLCRYDGYICNNYHHKNTNEHSLSSNRILSILEDSEGNIWIGTEGTPCLNLYNYNNDSFYVPEGQIWTDCRSLAEGDNGIIWVGTSNGLFYFKIPKQGSKIILNKISSELLNNTIIKKLVHTSNHLLWILTSDKVLCLNEKDCFIKSYQGEFIKKANDLYCDSNSTVLISHPSGIYIKRQNEADFQHINMQTAITTITQIGENIYMAGTEGDGIVLIERNKEKGDYKISFPAINAHTFFKANLIRSLYMDKSGCLWIGSGHNGLAIADLNSKPFYALRMPIKEFRPFIRSIYKDTQNRLWIGIKLGGVYILKDNHYTELDIEKKQNFNAIYEDTDRNIWICANHNIYIYRNEKLYKLTDLKGIPGDIYSKIKFASTIIQDQYGNIWIGGTGQLLVLKDVFKESFQFRLIDEPYAQDLYCMQKDVNGKLWFGSRSKGVFILNINDDGNVLNFSNLTTKNSPVKSDKIWCICIDRQGKNVYIATDSGMNEFNLIDSKFTNIKLPNRLANDKIMNIIEDEKGDLWLNTSQGVLRYNPASGFYREYDYNDGICSNAATEAGFLDIKDSTLYIGTSNGITYFNPYEIKDNIYSASPLITTLTFNNLKHHFNQEENLAFNKISLINRKEVIIEYYLNNFTIEFLAPNFQNTTRCFYAYKMEGIDHDWHYVTSQNKTVNYSNLNPGHYSFKVRTANSDGIWNETERMVKIKIKPAPWDTWWAYIIYVFIFIGIVLTIIKYYIIRLKLEKDIQIEHIQREHEQILNETRLKFHANISHEMRSTLTLISAPLNDLVINNKLIADTSPRLSVMQRNIKHLDNLLSQILYLQQIDEKAMPLKVRKLNIIPLVKNIFIRFEECAKKQNLDFKLLYDSNCIMGYFDEDKIIKIMSNLISNALKFTPPEGCVSVFITQTEDFVELAVEDTGCGIAPNDIEHIFDRFYRAQHQKKAGMGIGLALVKQLVVLHKGTVCAQNSINSSGALLSVRLPINDNAYTSEEIMDKMQSTDNKNDDNIYWEDKPTIIVVDDNEDICFYLQLNFSSQYNVLLAHDIETATRKIQKHVPDLILLDITLQGENGLELCDIIKQNLLTNHIPIIILSAKANDEDIRLAYEKGAEDYILKPFIMDVLSMKVKNIISSRKKTISSSSLDAVENEKNSEIESNPFLEQLLKIIQDNLSDSQFGIADICKKLNVSRTQLYRKVKAITPTSISTMIRDYRMKEAYKMLCEKEYTISEVMYRIGINSNSYFSRTFKEYYGVLPSDFIKNVNNKK